MTTKHDISEYFVYGRDELGAQYMLMVTDTFDYTDFPVFLLAQDDVHAAITHYADASKMTEVREVYKLTDNMEEQLAKKRCWNV